MHNIIFLLLLLIIIRESVAAGGVGGGWGWEEDETGHTKGKKSNVILFFCLNLIYLQKWEFFLEFWGKVFC
jgi:hypothetical protein